MRAARIIKKYPNRRLYDTQESRYITLADIRNIVVSQTNLMVIDKKSGEDITRSILLQVISEQEHNGDAILSEDFLAQIIRCYGRVAPVQLTQHLEQSLRHFMDQVQDFRNNEVVDTFGSETKNSLTSGP